MDSEIINKEIESKALQQITDSISKTIHLVRSGAITQNQASIEIAAAKHMCQAIALDWLYNKKLKLKVIEQA